MRIVTLKRCARLLIHLAHEREVPLRDDEHVSRVHCADVHDSQHCVVLVADAAGSSRRSYYLAEDTLVGHYTTTAESLPVTFSNRG